MRTADDVVVELKVDGAPEEPLVRAAYALGRSEGFAEGVEAARVLWVRGEGHRIRALRAPSPAAGAGPWFPPEVTAEEVAENRRWLGLPQQDADDAVDERIARSLAPSPKEAAPRCDACGGDAIHCALSGCPCGGTGRSTTGGGR